MKHPNLGVHETGSSSNVIFGGRLRTYRYIDINQSTAAALLTLERSIEPYLASLNSFRLKTVADAKS